MDDLKRWASLVPPAEDSKRITKECRGSIRDHNMRTALREIVAKINKRRTAGFDHAHVRGLEIMWGYVDDVLAVLRHRGYEVSTGPMAETVDLHVKWRTDATCGKCFGDADDVCLLDEGHQGPHGTDRHMLHHRGPCGA